MKVELYINGELHDTMTNRHPVEQAAQALKSKWWFLLSRNDWMILLARQSKMNDPAFIETLLKETT